MARRRTLNYREFRSYDEEGGEHEEFEDEEEEEAGDEEAEASEEEEEEEEAPVKKKKKKAPVKEAKPKRSRATKTVRQKVVWVVFDNSNKLIQKFPYSQRGEADALVEKLKAEKKQTYFVQPVKEPMEEK
jgi:hypothetical protein